MVDVDFVPVDEEGEELVDDCDVDFEGVVGDLFVDSGSVFEDGIDLFMLRVEESDFGFLFEVGVDLVEGD